jgi:hypothetical protein
VLPGSLTRLTRLHQLALSMNPLLALPSGLSALQRLKILEMYYVGNVKLQDGQGLEASATCKSLAELIPGLYIFSNMLFQGEPGSSGSSSTRDDTAPVDEAAAGDELQPMLGFEQLQEDQQEEEEGDEALAAVVGFEPLAAAAASAGANGPAAVGQQQAAAAGGLLHVDVSPDSAEGHHGEDLSLLLSPVGCSPGAASAVHSSPSLSQSSAAAAAPAAGARLGSLASPDGSSDSSQSGRYAGRGSSASSSESGSDYEAAPAAGTATRDYLTASLESADWDAHARSPDPQQQEQELAAPSSGSGSTRHAAKHVSWYAAAAAAAVGDAATAAGSSGSRRSIAAASASWPCLAEAAVAAAASAAAASGAISAAAGMGAPAGTAAATCIPGSGTAGFAPAPPAPTAGTGASASHHLPGSWSCDLGWLAAGGNRRSNAWDDEGGADEGVPPLPLFRTRSLGRPLLSRYSRGGEASNSPTGGTSGYGLPLPAFLQQQQQQQQQQMGAGGGGGGHAAPAAAAAGQAGGATGEAGSSSSNGSACEWSSRRGRRATAYDD